MTSPEQQDFSKSEVSLVPYEPRVPITEAQEEDVLNSEKSQEVAEQEALFILNRLRKPLERDQAAIFPEKRDENLGDLEQSLETLLSLAERQSIPFSGGVWQELKQIK